jgi:hypothetical protein
VTPLHIFSSSAAALPDGGFIVAWHTGFLLSGGGSNSEVKAQRFTAAGARVEGGTRTGTASPTFRSS